VGRVGAVVTPPRAMRTQGRPGEADLPGGKPLPKQRIAQVHTHTHTHTHCHTHTHTHTHTLSHTHTHTHTHTLSHTHTHTHTHTSHTPNPCITFTPPSTGAAKLAEKAVVAKAAAAQKSKQLAEKYAEYKEKTKRDPKAQCV
jgi:ABC-type Zn2+ transport system substrate-binding protein/surface adhesin